MPTDCRITFTKYDELLKMTTRKYFVNNKSLNSFILKEEPCQNTEYSLEPHRTLGCFRTFSEVDLEEVKRIREALMNHKPLQNIDLAVLTCLFDGQSVFSLFSNYSVFH